MAAGGALAFGISSSYAENTHLKSSQWTDIRPLYGQRAWEKNLLRHHVGARVFGVSSDEVSLQMSEVLEDSTQHGDALICDDPTIPIELGSGERVFDFALGQRFLLRRATFLNEGATGSVEILVAATDPANGNGRWVSIATKDIVAGEREQVVRFAAVEGRYVRLKFTLSEPGKIHGLGVFGIRKAVEFFDAGELENVDRSSEVIESAAIADRDDEVDLDESGPLVSAKVLVSSVTNTMGRAHVEQVSSRAADDTDLIARIMDEDSATKFQFSQNDPAPTLVIDLGRECDCGRVSVVYQHGQSGAMTMWLADSATIVGRASELDQLRLGDERLRPRLRRSQEDLAGLGRVSFNKFRRSGRYLVLQWTPEVAEVAAGGVIFGIHEVAVFEHAEAIGQPERLVQVRPLEEIRVIDQPEPQQDSNRFFPSGAGGLPVGGSAPISPDNGGGVLLIDEQPASR